MPRRLATKEQALRPIIEDVRAAVAGLEVAAQQIRVGDTGAAGVTYGAARERFNSAVEAAAIIFGSWGARPDLRLMPYRSVLTRVLGSTRMLIDAIPFLPSSHEEDARRAGDIVDLVQRHLTHELELLEDLPAAARREDPFHRACDRDERHDQVWKQMIVPLNDEIAGFTPKS